MEEEGENKIKVGIISPSKDVGTREPGKGFLEEKGFEALQLTGLAPPEGTNIANNPYAAAAEIIKMSREADVLWANAGGFYASKVADLLYQYGKDPGWYVITHANNPFTGEKLDYGEKAKEGFPENPPVIVGYSDITNTQNVLGQFGFPSVYAPTLEHRRGAQALDKTVEMLKSIKKGEEAKAEIPLSKITLPENRKIEGRIQAGCLNMLAGSMETNWKLKTDENTILAIEIVRGTEISLGHLQQLKDSGALENVKAVILGKVDGEKNQYKQMLSRWDIEVFELPDSPTIGHLGDAGMNNFQPITNFSKACIDLQTGKLTLENQPDKELLAKRRKETLSRADNQLKMSKLPEYKGEIDSLDTEAKKDEYIIKCFGTAITGEEVVLTQDNNNRGAYKVDNPEILEKLNEEFNAKKDFFGDKFKIDLKNQTISVTGSEEWKEWFLGEEGKGDKEAKYYKEMHSKEEALHNSKKELDQLKHVVKEPEASIEEKNHDLGKSQNPKGMER